MKKYFFIFTPFIAVVALIIFLMGKTIDEEERIMRWMIYLYFVVVSVIMHYGFTRAMTGRPQAFVRYHMASSMLKLLLHLGVIVFYAFWHPALAVRFIFTFFIMYFIFTVFEVVFIGRNVKK